MSQCWVLVAFGGGFDDGMVFGVVHLAEMLKEDLFRMDCLLSARMFVLVTVSG
jgi:hypothetical protein